jgi:hypothetical protein
MGANMKIKKSKATAKKKAMKTRKVQGISEVAKKVEVDSRKMKMRDVEVATKKKAIKIRKVQNAKNIINKTGEDSENRMLQDIIVIAENMGIDVVNLIKTELVRAIQRAEGNCDCYMSGEVLTCGQVNCLWREDCAPFEVVSICSSD